ncbi:Copper sensory histidine kinase CpxA [Klebsiella pneumoniae]|nr:Copper sensory histidine kinase CpxA [Klebsiella pneumoniae]
MLDNAAFEAEQMGKSFTVEYPPGPWPLYGNPNALESALENIVRNALRYSHTKISVSFSVDKDGITVNVDDDGRESARRIANRFSGHSTGPTRRATASPAAPAWGWRLSKPLFSSTAAG